MNFFTHGRRFLDKEPYFLAGTAVPDWLSIVDRKTRARRAQAEQHTSDQDARLAALARGVVQHHVDDAWFHENRAFVELNLEFSQTIREAIAESDTLRPNFVGHILIELLLDAQLILEDPAALDRYYSAMEQVDAKIVETSVNKIASRPTSLLSWGVVGFMADRYLYDYVDDDKLHWRLNRIMNRVKLPPLPDVFRELLPQSRQRIADQKNELLPANGDN